MNCPSCGGPITDQDQFCGNCGAQTQGPAASPPAPPQTAMAPPPQSPPPGTTPPPVQAPAQQSYIPPGAQTAGPVPDKASGLALGALLCGFLSFCCGCVGGIPAIVLGFVELSKIKKGESSAKGKTFAIMGIILGFLGIVVNFVLSVALNIFGLAMENM